MLGEAVVVYPFFSIMFNERSGISAAGVGTLLAVWQIVQILAEVPTGVIADRYSKKYSIIAGKIGKMLCFVIWFLWPNFTGYMAGFVLWGIGEACISGAAQAYLYELDSEDSSHFLKRYARLKSLMMATYSLTFFFTFLIGPRYPLLIALSALTMLVTAVIAITLPASKPREVLKSAQILTEAKSTLIRSKVLILKFVRGLSIAGILGMLLELVGVIFRYYGMRLSIIPLVISCIALISSASFWLLHYYQAFIRRHYIACTVIFLAIFLIMFPLGFWFKVTGFVIITRYLRILAVMLESDLQEDLPNSSRATITSAYSLVEKLLVAVFLFLAGISAINNSVAIPTLAVIILSCTAFIVVELVRPQKESPDAGTLDAVEIKI